MTLLLALLVVAHAEPVPVSLPDPTAAGWAEALRAAELVAVAPQLAQVRIEDEGAAWRILVVGTSRTARLPAPRSVEDRATVAWLAASLARSLALPVAPRPGSDPPPAPPEAPAAGEVPVTVFDGSRPKEVLVPRPGP